MCTARPRPQTTSSRWAGLTMPWAQRSRRGACLQHRSRSDPLLPRVGAYEQLQRAGFVARPRWKALAPSTVAVTDALAQPTPPRRRPRPSQHGVQPEARRAQPAVHGCQPEACAASLSYRRLLGSSRGRRSISRRRTVPTAQYMTEQTAPRMTKQWYGQFIVIAG